MKSAITDKSLEHFRQLVGSHVTKEDIFFYTYGVFHCRNYVEKFANTLNKEMPQIPCLPEYYNKILKAGRELGVMHVNYETYPLFNATIDKKADDYTVTKMRFGENNNRSIIIYNSYITVRDIPDIAYNYHIDSKSVIELFMSRYRYTVDKNSGIINNPNLYRGGRYIFELLLRVINVSIRTVNIKSELDAIIF